MDQIEERVQRRRASGGRPRDLPVLAAAGHRERSAWYRRTKRRAQRSAAAGLLIGLAASALILFEEWQNDSFFPVPLWIPEAATALVALILVVGVLGHLIGRLRDPLLMIGQVAGGVSMVTQHPEQFKRYEPAQTAGEWLKFSYWNSIVLEVKAVARLHADGTLSSEPGWHGTKEIGVRSRLHRELLDFEHCAFLCAGDGSALFRVGDLAAGGSRSRRTGSARSRE